MCMRDVFTTIGNPKEERRRRKTYNQRFTMFGWDIPWNYHETNTNAVFDGVSPNEEPRCPQRGHAYWILYWFMLECLITHELSHVFQGHLDFLKQRWLSELNADDKRLRVRMFLEMLVLRSNQMIQLI